MLGRWIGWVAGLNLGFYHRKLTRTRALVLVDSAEFSVASSIKRVYCCLPRFFIQPLRGWYVDLAVNTTNRRHKDTGTNELPENRTTGRNSKHTQKALKSARYMTAGVY